MNRGLLFEFFARHRYGVLGTVSPAGAPQSAVVGIAVTPELEIVFDTVKASRKYANLAGRPACSLVVWTGEATAQYEGVAFEPTGADRERYLEIYFRTWPECREHLSWPGITHFVIRPTWIRYSDYDANPPVIQEFGPALLP